VQPRVETVTARLVVVVKKSRKPYGTISDRNRFGNILLTMGIVSTKLPTTVNPQHDINHNHVSNLPVVNTAC